MSVIRLQHGYQITVRGLNLIQCQIQDSLIQNQDERDHDSEVEVDFK